MVHLLWKSTTPQPQPRSLPCLNGWRRDGSKVSRTSFKFWMSTTLGGGPAFCIATCWTTMNNHPIPPLDIPQVRIQLPRAMSRYVNLKLACKSETWIIYIPIKYLDKTHRNNWCPFFLVIPSIVEKQELINQHISLLWPWDIADLIIQIRDFPWNCPLFLGEIDIFHGIPPASTFPRHLWRKISKSSARAEGEAVCRQRLRSWKAEKVKWWDTLGPGFSRTLLRAQVCIWYVSCYFLEVGSWGTHLPRVRFCFWLLSCLLGLGNQPRGLAKGCSSLYQRPASSRKWSRISQTNVSHGRCATSFFSIQCWKYHSIRHSQISRMAYVMLFVHGQPLAVPLHSSSVYSLHFSGPFVAKKNQRIPLWCGNSLLLNMALEII